MPRRRPDPYVAHIAAWIDATGHDCPPDRAQAGRFLEWLDPGAAFFSFRTFSEMPYTRSGAADPLEFALHGSLAQCWDRLVALNRAGAAVTVTLNATSGDGRGVDDVRRVRCLFLDDDDPRLRRRPFALEPHVVVASSPGRFHYYWKVEGVPLERFSQRQRRLAAVYGGDHRVFALNQSMGLAGFWRRKRSTLPNLTRLLRVEPCPALGGDDLRRLLAGPD